MSRNYVEIVAKENEEQTLYQWDTDRKLKVLTDDDITVDEVHFSNAFTQQALIIVPTASAELGCMVADIPNILLQYFIPIDVYVVMYSDKGERTVYMQQLEIVKRAKPSDYVYTETEVLDYKSLEKRVSELEQGGGSGILKEIDPTVPDWAKQPQKPSYTAEEVGAMPDTTEIPTKISDLEDDSNFVSREILDEDLKGYVKDTDYATYEKAGLLKLDRASGLALHNNNIYIDTPNDTELQEKKTVNAPLKPNMIDKIVKYGLTDNQLDWTDEEKKSALGLLGAVQKPNVPSSNSVIGINPEGIIGTHRISTLPIEWGLPLYNGDGNITTNEPKTDLESTNKKYVDDSISNYGQLELINSVEISEEITALSISEDMNGKPFELRKAIMFYYCPKYEGETEIPSYCFAELNGKTMGDYHVRSNAYTIAFKMPDKINAISGLWSIEQDIKNKIRTEKAVGDKQYDNKPDLFPGYYNNKTNEWNVINDEVGTIKSIGFAGGLAFEGCKFILYGVRA